MSVARDDETREGLLTQTFVDLADTLVGDYDVVDLLHTLTSRCVEIFRVAEAGILLKEEGGSLAAVASSSENAETMEILQLESESGPCWEVLATGKSLHVKDLAAYSDRWPAYAEKGLELGIRSIVALPLRLRDQRVGALNLFQTEIGASSPEDIKAMQAMADVATIGLLQARAIHDAEGTAGHLRIALDRRVAIEQAKGIVSENLRVGVAEAFALLRRHARNNNRKLTNVAQDVIDGALTPEDLASD